VYCLIKLVGRIQEKANLYIIVKGPWWQGYGRPGAVDEGGILFNNCGQEVRTRAGEFQ
jgi:hypothetical protein